MSPQVREALGQPLSLLDSSGHHSIEEAMNSYVNLSEAIRAI